MSAPRVVVIGAGLGGLTAAAVLARQGVDVTVLEAHVAPGGCAATFLHRGYRFDAGATLAGGFYPGGPMDQVARAAGLESWPLLASDEPDPVMAVHLPGGQTVLRWSGAQGREEYRRAFGPQAQPFWDWQERAAAALWALALHNPPWPPQGAADWNRLLRSGAAWLGREIGQGRAAGLPGLAVDAFRPLAAHLTGQPETLRLFVDGQLLISAQAESREANALYAAAALDLPRRGVAHLAGGMGAIAERLAQAVIQHGGRVLYRRQAMRIRLQGRRPVAVEARLGKSPAVDSFPAEVVIANLTPWSAAALFDADAPPGLRRLAARPLDGWGAFTVYAALDGACVPPGFPLHHQVLAGRPLGEGRSVFLSLSPAQDAGRAPVGKRVVSLSTHTRFGPWWDLYKTDPPGYAARRQEYAARLLALAGQALPGLAPAVEWRLTATPLTFARYTRRAWGWVGGFPQTSLLRAPGPQLAPGMWLVGDSIFPGQSTAAAALGGLRVARNLLDALAGSFPARLE